MSRTSEAGFVGWKDSQDEPKFSADAQHPVHPTILNILLLTIARQHDRRREECLERQKQDL